MLKASGIPFYSSCAGRTLSRFGATKVDRFVSLGPPSLCTLRQGCTWLRRLRRSRRFHLRHACRPGIILDSRCLEQPRLSRDQCVRRDAAAVQITPEPEYRRQNPARDYKACQQVLAFELAFADLAKSSTCERTPVQALDLLAAIRAKVRPKKHVALARAATAAWAGTAHQFRFTPRDRKEKYRP